jgi:hypothetical protein
MYDLLAQIILAQRRDDTEGWMNILFVVVLAIFWAVGGIIKAKSKSSETNGKKTMPRRPAHRPSARVNPLQEQLLKQSRQPSEPAERRESHPTTKKPVKKFSEIRAAVQKFAAEAEQAFQAQAGKPVPETKIPVPKPKVKPDILKSPESSRKSVIQLQDKQAAVPAEMLESEYLSELLLDYTDPEELRRAILHYEILGRPLSLRDPSGNLIGF